MGIPIPWNQHVKLLSTLLNELQLSLVLYELKNVLIFGEYPIGFPVHISPPHGYVLYKLYIYIQYMIYIYIILYI